MKINYWSVMFVVLFAAAALFIPVDVLASGGDPFAKLSNRVCTTWTESKKIVYIIGGIAALTLGVLAFFGRFKWTTFFALVGGMFLIAIFDQIVGFATTGGQSANSGCAGI